jgi:hypothetical protein
MRVIVSLFLCSPSSRSAERRSDLTDLHASRSGSGSDLTKSLPSPSNCMSRPRLECDADRPCDTAFSQPKINHGANKKLDFSSCSSERSSCESVLVPSAIKPFPIDAAQTWHSDSRSTTVLQSDLSANSSQCPPSPFIMSDQNVPFLSAEQLVELSPIHSAAAEYRQAQCMRRRAVSALNLHMESACEETIAETHRHLTALVGESAHLPKQHLIRPAFRLIFDIARHAVRHSAFASGVFTVNELDPRPGNPLFSDVKSKAIFLRKLIRASNDAAAAAGLQVVHADCREILAGRCATTTNLLLQNIGRLALAAKVGKLARCSTGTNTIEALSLPAPALGVDASRPGKCTPIAACADTATAGAASDIANEMGAMSIFDLLAME